MTETARLVIGTTSLSATFTNCVDCFENVQLGQNFGGDYQESLLKFNIARLRLSRWAHAADELHNQPQVPTGWLADAQIVEDILGRIIACFADTERTLQELQVYNTEERSEPTAYKKMRDLALKHQQRSKAPQGIIWTLYEKKDFNELMGKIIQYLESLNRLFPTLQQRQSELAVEDIQEIELQLSLTDIKIAAEGIDSFLVSSVQRALAARRSHNFMRNTVTDDADVQYGDKLARGLQDIGVGHSFVENIASGKAKSLYGNQYL